MRFSRLTAATLSIAAALIPLTGCSSNQSDESTDGVTDITYWLWQDNATDATWENLAQEFNASQDKVKVTLQVIPLDQYQNQLTTAIMNNTAPDAARSKDWWLGEFAPQGAIADLSAYVDSWDGKSDVVEELWNTGRLPGKSEIYMMPHQYTTLYMYYRKDLFKAAGLEAPTTQDELLEAAKALTGGKQYGIDVRGGGGGQDQWIAWMFAGGAQVVDSQGKVVLDDSTAVSVNQKYLDLVTKLQATPPGSITAAFADVKTNFASGITAMMIHHPGSLSEMRQTFGDDLGVIPIPTNDGQPGATLGSMSGNVILNNSQKKDAAWAWISWLDTKAPMDKISTSPQGQLPVLSSSLTDEHWKSDAGLVIATELIARAKTWPALASVAQLSGKDWNPTIQSAFQDQLTSQEALTRMADVLRKS
jgi:multiple sugar transport system substrate-binding protein